MFIKVLTTEANMSEVGGSQVAVYMEVEQESLDDVYVQIRITGRLVGRIYEPFPDKQGQIRLIDHGEGFYPAEGIVRVVVTEDPRAPIIKKDDKKGPRLVS